MVKKCQRNEDIEIMKGRESEIHSLHTIYNNIKQ